MDEFLKSVETSILSNGESYIKRNIPIDNVVYTLCDRKNLNEETSNYFSSFNLFHDSNLLKKSNEISKIYPELYQLNVDKFVFIPIDSYYYSDLIDGRTISFYVPNNLSVIKLVSSTYSNLQKSQNNPLLGKNISFLFSDNINLPYTGTTNNGSINNYKNTTWNSKIKFPAVSFSDLEENDYGTDLRPWSLVKQSFSAGSSMEVSESFPKINSIGYKYDIPVGFVCLDKGYIVLTHKDIINNIPWGNGYLASFSGDSNYDAPQSVIAGPLNTSLKTKNIVFKDLIFYNPNGSKNVLEFNSVTTQFKTISVCIAKPEEFFLSSNNSWPLNSNLLKLNNGSNDFDNIYITEIGLYNKNKELIAVAKMSEPILKEYSGIKLFNLEIDV